MTLRQRIYLDNAATSWPKPEAVYQATDRYQRELGAPVGRGAYHEAVEVERLVARARAGIAQMLGVADPQRIAFTANCTAALNVALHGLLRRGDHVVTTAVEHNSVLRPLRDLEDKGLIEVTRIGCDVSGVVDPAAVQAALRTNTRLVAVSHASNVTGIIQPVAEIAALGHQVGALVLVDAAQTLGHLPVDVDRLGADLLAAPGHKGLLGPLGTGFLYVSPQVESQLQSTTQGGTGTRSEDDRQPNELPSKYESGNHNAVGLVGLEAGLVYLRKYGIHTIAEHIARLRRQLCEGLSAIGGVTLFGDPAQASVGIVSLIMAGYDPQELATMLDSAYHIQGRAGLHCAPLMHQSLGSLASGGAYRLSIGPFNTSEQIEMVITAITDLSASRISDVNIQAPLSSPRGLG